MAALTQASHIVESYAAQVLHGVAPSVATVLRGARVLAMVVITTGEGTTVARVARATRVRTIAKAPKMYLRVPGLKRGRTTSVAEEVLAR